MTPYLAITHLTITAIAQLSKLIFSQYSVIKHFYLCLLLCPPQCSNRIKYSTSVIVRVFQGCFKAVSRLFHRPLHHITGVYQLYLLHIVRRVY